MCRDAFCQSLSIKKKLAEGTVTVRAIPTKDKWYGITYREDLPVIKEAMAKYIAEGLYD